MEQYHLVRYRYSSKETLGILFVGDLAIHTMEDPDLMNMQGVSCILEGTYNVYKLPLSASGKFRDCFHITNVENREGILIHEGNTARDTTGCILVGMLQGYLSNQKAVLKSRDAMEILNSRLPAKFQLVISKVGSEFN